MKRSDYTEANRQAWNAAMPYHRKAKDSYWDACFADRNWIFQTEPELSELNKLGIQGKNIVHLCCNNGIELLSLKRMGAGYCLGIDICDVAIGDAKRRAVQFALTVDFLRSDVYAVNNDHNGEFDIVYITIGALTWLPDLPAFFALARRLLKNTGSVFIYEQHPLMNVLAWDTTDQSHTPELVESYFRTQSMAYYDSLDYYGNQEYDSPVKYEWLPTLTDIISALIDNGFVLTAFQEYEHDISGGLSWVQKTGLRLPLSYILTARVQN